MPHPFALPRSSRSALDDSLIVLRLAVLYALLGLGSHYLAAWLMRRGAGSLHIDTQFLLLDAIFGAGIILGSLLIAWLLRPGEALRWLFGPTPSRLRVLLLALVGAAVMVAIADPLAGWLDLRISREEILPEPVEPPRGVAPLLELKGGRLVAGLAIAILWIPLAEELVFRGWLFKGLAHTRPGLLVALPSTTIIFALLHSFYSPGGVLVIGLLGAFLGWLRWRFDQLLPCVLCHALYNGLTLLMVALW
jgi:membrane protease YdiL (CAAX protease family)